MLSSSLQGVISQALLKKEGGGRVAAHEIMVGTNAVRNLIRENQLAQLYSMIQTGSRYGMQTMEDSMNDLVLAGLVSEETAHTYMKDSSDSTDDLSVSATLPNGAKAPVAAGKGKPAPAAAKESDDGGYSF
jgi:twitching motility protein PilT